MGLAGEAAPGFVTRGRGALSTLSGIVCENPVKRAVWDVKG